MMSRPSDLGHAPVSGVMEASLQASFSCPSTVARIAPPAADEHLTPQVRYARQPIVDRAGKVVATELLFRWNSRDGGVGPELGAYATATALANALLDGQLLTGSAAVDAPIGDLFVNLDGRCLMSPIAEIVTADIGVIELLETVAVDEPLRRRVCDLHARGYRFALDDLVSVDDARWSLAPYAQFAKIDVLGLAPATLKRLIDKAHQLGLAVIAEKIDDAAALQRLMDLGADYFQGYGIARPVTAAVQALPGCDSRALGQLYQLACAEAHDTTLALVAGRHPALVARLLRLQAIHAPQFTVTSETLADVLASLPRPVLVGWLVILNIAAAHGRDQALTQWLHGELASHREQLRHDGAARGSAGLEKAAFQRCKQLLRTHLGARSQREARALGAEPVDLRGQRPARDWAHEAAAA